MNLNVQLQFVFSLIEDIINSLRSNLLCVSSHLSQKMTILTELHYETLKTWNNQNKTKKLFSLSRNNWKQNFVFAELRFKNFFQLIVSKLNNILDMKKVKRIFAYKQDFYIFMFKIQWKSFGNCQVNCTLMTMSE